MMYSLSVIIPNYNNERFLQKCLDSVLAQTYSPKEIIVIDDVSTDNSREIIRSYEMKDPRIIGIYLERNGGVSHARNVGLKAATSEYVTTLDADDFYFNERKLENEMALVEKHGGNILAYSKLVYVNETNELIRYVNYPAKQYVQGCISNKLIAGYRENTIPRDYCFPSAVLAKTGLYDETSSLFEDLDFLIRVTQVVPTYCTFEYGTGYRIKDFGLSKRPIEVLNKAKTEIFHRYYGIESKSNKKKIRFLRCIVGIRQLAKKLIKKAVGNDK